MLTKDQILAAADMAPTELPVPEWGGSVFIRVMTGTERDAFEQSILDSKKGGGMVNVRARLAVRVLCDETGGRIFTDADAVALGAKSGKALDRIFDSAQKVNGIGNKEVEELSGNSAAAQSGDSTSI
jgi:hypothetical protein